MMDDEECYRWGEIFIKPRHARSVAMAGRAKAMGLVQKERENILVWHREASEECRWVFVESPSDIGSIRAIYNNDENVQSPSCFVVVRQRDPGESRGDVVFDIFRLNSQSYLWHFHRVYTRPKNMSG